jgi:hypothetical protein
MVLDRPLYGVMVGSVQFVSNCSGALPNERSSAGKLPDLDTAYSVCRQEIVPLSPEIAWASRGSSCGAYCFKNGFQLVTTICVWIN